jgi:hypothetical protein
VLEEIGIKVRKEKCPDYKLTFGFYGQGGQFYGGMRAKSQLVCS